MFALSDSWLWNCLYTYSSTPKTKSSVLSGRGGTEEAKFPGECSETSSAVTFDVLIVLEPRATISVASSKRY